MNATVTVKVGLLALALAAITALFASRFKEEKRFKLSTPPDEIGV